MTSSLEGVIGLCSGDGRPLTWTEKEQSLFHSPKTGNTHDTIKTLLEYGPGGGGGGRVGVPVLGGKAGGTSEPAG